MFIIFFLFQFSNVALESWNHYEENSYIVDTAEIPDRSDAYGAESADNRERFVADGRETVVYIGGEEEAVGETVSIWAAYTKRNFLTYLSPEEYEETAAQEGVPPAIAVIAVDAAGIDWSRQNNCDALERCVKAGIDLVFLNLPEVSVIKENEGLRELLGIEMTRAERMAVTEVYLHEGFLLGGEAFYSPEGPVGGVAFTLPWYVVSGESEIYMNGVPEKSDMGTEPVTDAELPAVIWKRNAETASVFAVNGDYMEDSAGIGILSAISAKISPYEIYPVINAQNMIYANYPGLTNENEEFLMERYSQSSEGIFQNVVWPEMVAVRRDNRLSLSCMLAPQFDYEDEKEPDGDQFQRYMKLLNEQSAETGLSGARVFKTPVERKLKKDQEFMQKELPTYRFTSFYADGLTEDEVRSALDEELLDSVRTVVEDCSDNTEVIGYLSDYITRQSALIDGFEDAAQNDFRVRCLETALGYNSVLADLKDIIYPEDSETDWVFASNTLRQNIQDYRIGKQGFDNTAVSECDLRIRRFLALDYKDSREFNMIRLELNDTGGPVWFVLRTDHEKIDSIEGGSWKELEDGAYLITAQEQELVITLKSAY